MCPHPSCLLLLPLGIWLTPCPACHPAAFTPFCPPYSPVVISVRERPMLEGSGVLWVPLCWSHISLG